MAQAFRHARAMIFSLVPRLLSQLGSKHNEMELEELLRWCKSRPGRTVVDAVRSASAKKELGNQYVLSPFPLTRTCSTALLREISLTPDTSQGMTTSKQSGLTSSASSHSALGLPTPQSCRLTRRARWASVKCEWPGDPAKYN